MNPWAAGWFTNFVIKVIVVRTLTRKLIDPITIYKCAKDTGNRAKNKSKRKSGSIKTPTPITRCKVTIPMIRFSLKVEWFQRTYYMQMWLFFASSESDKIRKKGVIWEDVFEKNLNRKRPEEGTLPSGLRAEWRKNNKNVVFDLNHSYTHYLLHYFQRRFCYFPIFIPFCEARRKWTTSFLHLRRSGKVK